jgi:hypothetical protein
MPLSEVLGKAGTAPPLQIVRVVPKLKTGVAFGLTVTFKIVIVAHCPAIGVKTYVPELWLSITDGLQVPVMPLVDVAGSDGTTAPAQMPNDVPKLNEGVMLGFTVTEKLAVVAHDPGVGVNV